MLQEVYRIKVRQYMTKPSTPEFSFHDKWNGGKEMPMRIMVGRKLQETKGMVKMELWGELTEETPTYCMKCGRPLTNPVSKYFGIGPECGGHNYTHPFDSEEELKKAVADVSEKLRNVTWTGWVIKSAIEEQTLVDKREFEDVPEGVNKDKEEKKFLVTIEIKESNKLSEEYSAFVSFPYNNELIALIRSFSSRFWHANTKQWEIPERAVQRLIEALNGKEYKLIGELHTINEEVVVPDGFEFKTNPFQHQVEGFKYGLIHDKFLLGDEQGLGKTKQVIDIAIAKKLTKGYKHCLIICGVNGLKWNWVSEIKTHSDEECYILGQRNKNGKIVIEGNPSRLTDINKIDELPYFIITNVETLRNEAICAVIAAHCKNGTIGIVAADEVHKMKNPASQQGKAFLKLLPDTRIAMTGTPLMNSPLDLYIILKWLGKEKHSFYQFRNHYCVMGGYGGYEIVRYRNLEELQERLDENMIRRLKTDVLDLPDKIHTTEFVEMSKEQVNIYNEVKDEIRRNIDKIKLSPNPLSQLIRLRQATGYTGILSSTVTESAKLNRLEELAEDVVTSGEKFIVFSNWTDITGPVYERLHKYNPAIITGETTDRVEQQNKFMNDPTCKCIVGTIGAMGTGLTLTAANTVFFMDSPWNKALKDQAEDRAHRIGTKSTVNIITLVVKDSIDERIEQLVYKKGKMSDMLVDGQFDKVGEETIDFLLS